MIYLCSLRECLRTVRPWRMLEQRYSRAPLIMVVTSVGSTDIGMVIGLTA